MLGSLDLLSGFEPLGAIFLNLPLKPGGLETYLLKKLIFIHNNWIPRAGV